MECFERCGMIKAARVGMEDTLFRERESLSWLGDRECGVEWWEHRVREASSGSENRRKLGV
jgi:hypothetical protein